MLPSPGTVLGLDPLGLGVPGLCSPQVPREAPWGCAGLLRAPGAAPLPTVLLAGPSTVCHLPPGHEVPSAFSGSFIWDSGAQDRLGDAALG